MIDPTWKFTATIGVDFGVCKLMEYTINEIDEYNLHFLFTIWTTWLQHSVCAVFV